MGHGRFGYRAGVRVELINTGSELLLGRILNTHQQWICRRLADAGWPVERQVAVPDTGSAIREAVAEALGRADLVIVTGGLGPTSDDLTRDMIAELLGRPLHVDAGVLAHIESIFAARNRRMPGKVGVQAQVPEGATVLANAHGTAPGLAMEVEAGRFRAAGSWLVMLPGPPRELHPMFDRQVLPWIRDRRGSEAPFRCLTLRTCGIGESWVEERLAPSLPGLLQRGLEIGYCARTGEVDVRLVATGVDAAALVAEGESLVREKLGEHIYGVDDELLEAAVIGLAKERGASLVVAESCTGGFVANRLTNVPGASEVFLGGWVTYDNRVKVGQLGVRPETLEAQGAVSEACAREMAEGARERAGARHALALTGIAGPGGGTAEKPVGTLFIALASEGEPTVVRRQFNPVDRETFKYVASQQALELLRRRLLGVLPGPGGGR